MVEASAQIPRRIRFRGNDLAFTSEVRFLLADEAAYASIGAAPEHREMSSQTRERQAISRILEAFTAANRADEGYTWLVTETEELDGHRPIESVSNGDEDVVLRLAGLYLSR